MLLTQKIETTTASPGDFDLKDLHTKQWKQVQSLADIFWRRWKQEYLAPLTRAITHSPHQLVQTHFLLFEADKPNLQVGDVVLLKDTQAPRNKWPVGLIVKAVSSSDSKVRKVEVKGI
ncbi:uncharacterized protein WCC33_018569, partial [Rhinophrynus dorsalis]